MWYGFQNTNGIPPRYFAAVARALELLPASISRACARGAPFLSAIRGNSADDDELLTVGWRSRADPSAVSLIFGRYGKGGFRPLGRGIFERRPLELERLERENLRTTFLDPNTRTVLTSDQFFSTADEEQGEQTPPPSGGEGFANRLEDPRDPAGIAREMERNLKNAMKELYAKPLVIGTLDVDAPEQIPLPEKVYPPTDDCQREAYESFKSLMSRHTKSLSFSDRNFGIGDEKLKIFRTKLLFSPGFDLFEVKADHRSGFVIALLSDRAFRPIYLTATSAVIHDRLIKPGKLIIDKDTVRQYLRFFGRFVHGDQGAFPIIERASQLKWRFETRALQAEMERQLLPVRLLRELEANELLGDDIDPGVRTLARKIGSAGGLVQSLAACVSFGRTLSFAWFVVFQNGEVRMMDDWELVSELPVYPQMFTDKENFVLVQNESE